MLKFLANISYPLYVVHPLVGYALMRVMIAWNAPYPLALATALVVVVLLAWVIHVAGRSAVHGARQDLGASYLEAAHAAGRGGVRFTPSRRLGPASAQQGT